jgi:hypothetical protein
MTSLQDIETAEREVILAAYYAYGAFTGANFANDPVLSGARDQIVAACEKATAARRAYLAEYDQRIAAIAAKAGAAAC